MAKSFSLLVELRDKITGPLKGIASPLKSFVEGAEDAKKSLKALNAAGRELSFAEKATASLGKLTPKLEVQRRKLDEIKSKLAATNKLMANGDDNKAYARLQARLSHQVAAIRTLSAKETQYKTQLSATRQQLKKVGIQSDDLTSARKQLTQRTDNARAADIKYKKNLQSIKSIVPGVKRSLGAIKITALATAASMAGVGYGLTKLTGDLSKTAKDLTAASTAFNISTDKLQLWQQTGTSFSDDLGADKIKDIFKDVQDKVGDFSLTGGGEAKDFFEKLKLDIKEFKNLAPDVMFLKIGRALDKSKLTQSEKIFLLEGLANDASLLLPLLDNNAKALRDMQALAADANATLSKQDITTLLEAGRQTKELGMYWQGAKQQFGVAIADVWVKSNINVLLKDWLKAATEFIKLKASSDEFKAFLGELPGKLEAGATAALNAGRYIVSLIEGIKGGVDAVREFGETWKVPIESVREFVGGWDTLGIVGVVGVKFGGAALSAGEFVSKLEELYDSSRIVRAGMDGVVKGLRIAKTAVVVLGRAVLMNPLGLLVTAVAGAGYLIYKNWDKIYQSFTGFRDRIKGMSWPNIALEVIKGLASLPSTLFECGVNSVGQFTTGLLKDWGLIDQSTADNINVIISNFAALPRTLFETGDAAIGSLIDGISSKKDALITLVSDIMDDLKAQAKALIQDIMDIPDKIKQGVKSLRNDAINKAAEAGEAITGSVSNAWQETKNWWNSGNSTDNRITNNVTNRHERVVNSTQIQNAYPARHSLEQKNNPQKTEVGGEITVKIEAPKGYIARAKVRRPSSQLIGITADVGRAAW